MSCRLRSLRPLKKTRAFGMTPHRFHPLQTDPLTGRRSASPSLDGRGGRPHMLPVSFAQFCDFAFYVLFLFLAGLFFAGPFRVALPCSPKTRAKILSTFLS